MNNTSDDGMAMVGLLGLMLLAWMMWLLSAITIVATFISRLAYYLVNFLTGGLLDKFDALLILSSAILFSLFGWGGALASMPKMLEAGIPPQEAIWSLMLTGFIFGMGIGDRLLNELWNEAMTPSATAPRFVEALNLPSSHYDRQQIPEVEPEREISLEELERMFAQESVASHR